MLRVSGTQDSVLALVENLLLPLCGLLFLMLILSGIMASVISKRIVKPVNELDLEHPEENKIYEELSPLLGKIHKQNRQIQKQLELAKQQQEEFSLITENMQEGLIVIDRYTMILSANSSAWNLFRVDKVCQGESVYCLDRAEDFRHAIEQVLSRRTCGTDIEIKWKRYPVDCQSCGTWTKNRRCCDPACECDREA